MITATANCIPATNSTTLTDVLTQIHDAIDVVKSLSANDLGKSHEIKDAYIQDVTEERGRFASSIVTQELTEKLLWNDDFITDILIDDSWDDVYDDFISFNGLEEVVEAEDTISEALEVLHKELFCIERDYKRVQK